MFFIYKVFIFEGGQSSKFCDIINMSVSSVREEVEPVVNIINFVISVMGSVVGNLITKWFDRKD